MAHIDPRERFLMPGAIALAGAFIGLGIFAGGSQIAGSLGGATLLSSKTAQNSALQAQAKAGTPAKIAAVTSKDHIRGNSNAKVMMVEYSDTECPFCKRFHATLNQVLSAHTAKGDVAWVYRHNPLAIHPRAQKEAEATECAAEQGGNTAFWKYLDRLIEVTPSNNGLNPAELPKIAQYIGICEIHDMSRQRHIRSENKGSVRRHKCCRRPRYPVHRSRYLEG
jgi:protein-disulfide isomerase